jgi:6-phosphogluconolactonase
MNTLRPLLIAYLSLAAAFPTFAANQLVYFGTSTRPDDPQGSQGIYVSQFDDATGKLGQPILAAETANPGFLEIHPHKPHLYATARPATRDRNAAGAVSAFSIDPASGTLTLLNTQSSGGAGPCHVTVDNTGKVLVVANYSGGSCGSLPINEDGSLGPMASFFQHEGSSVNPERQKEAHAHSANFDPGNQFAFVADLGLDKVLVYKVDTQTGQMAPHAPSHIKLAPGAGPRHIHFHPTGQYAWVINELNSTLTGFSYDPDKGILTEIETVSTLPTGFDEKNSTAEVRVHPTGKFVYGSNRGHNSIAVFTIDENTGKVSLVENEPTRGEIPRNFNIDPSGKWLLAANQNSDNITVFSIDQDTGALDFTGQEIRVAKPMCVRFLPLN